MNTFMILFIVTVLIIAVYTDTRHHKLPNYLTFSAMFIGLLSHFLNGGINSLFISMIGLLLGIGLLIGGTGARDVKLMGAVGALLGPTGAFIAFLATAIVGGIDAIGLLAFRGYLNDAGKRYWAILKTYLCNEKICLRPSI